MDSPFIKKAGVKNVTGHACRKTFITRLVRANTPLPTVARLAGVSIPVIVGVYNEIGSDDMRAAILKLDGGVA